MNFNKIIPIMGLLIMLILAIGSASASDVDSESVGEAANDLTVEEAIVDVMHTASKILKQKIM